MIFRLISRGFFRLIQLAVLAFFGYWIYTKIAVGGLEFAMLSLTTLPFLMAGLVIGLIISLVFAFKKTTFKSTKIFNVILLLLYLASSIYLATLFI